MNKCILLCACFLLSACIELKDPEKAKNERTETANAVSQINYQIMALDKPNHYLVKFENLSEVARIQRLQRTQGEKSIWLEGPEDIVEVPGALNYRILDQGREHLMTVEIPQDQVVEGIQGLSDDKLEKLPAGSDVDFKWSISGRLFFKSQAQLVTEGRRILIQADRIYSEGARVTTWPEGATASDTNPGRHGGRIFLKSPIFEGRLHFEMRGENGSIGELWFGSGKRPENVFNKGTDGGHSGQLWVDVPNMQKGSVTYELLPGKGGIGQDIEGMRKDIHNNHVKFVLKSSMGNGHDGLSQMPCLIIKNQCTEFK